MIKKLETLYSKYLELNESLKSPDICADYNKYAHISKSISSMENIITKYKEYKKFNEQLNDDKVLLEIEQDESMRSEIKNDISLLNEKIVKIEEELKILLLPEEPNDAKNAILEIRAGTGGDEAGIFAGDLFRMYSRYADIMHWKVNIVNCVECESGGYKEIVCNVIGNGVYGFLKFESGVHRVQRVPITETQGRIHTSAASVVVLPEIENIDIQLNMNDVRKDIFCSSGAGGQSVNTTYSAVRLTHIPTGIVVSCQDERSQLRNMEKAIKILKSRLYKLKQEEQDQNLTQTKKNMVKSGDRSDKIRTYNFPQDRITDHRINYTLHNLHDVLNGNLQNIIDNLIIAYNAERLSNQS